MISKERLEELMRNCAVIYGIEFDKIESYDLSDEDICISPAEFRDYGLRIFNSLGYWNDIRFENLFESKKEAEWHKEFGCIERTEKLELPTWEEVQKCSLYTLYFNNQELYLYRVYFNRDAKTITIEEQNEEYLECFTEIEELQLTKENYLRACRKCKELFLGGSDGDIR